MLLYALGSAGDVAPGESVELPKYRGVLQLLRRFGGRRRLIFLLFPQNDEKSLFTTF
jgi:hypothetical protein